MNFYKDQAGNSKEEYRKPETNPNDLVFSLRNYKNNKKLKGTYLQRTKSQNNYVNMLMLFNKTLDRIKMGNREYGNEKRREITFHSFRRFVKSTISGLGWQDYSEWFLGHSGSTYWRKKEKENAEIFLKVQPYLTFLDIEQMERKGADMETKIEELQTVNQHLVNEQIKRDKQIEVLNSQVKDINEIIGQRFAELLTKYNLTDRKFLNNKNKKEPT
jgi:hypothetical protein